MQTLPNSLLKTDKVIYGLNILEHGQYAEQSHIGKTKHFIESGYTEWYIPVNKVGRSLNYPIVTINNNQFYVAVGSKANHFIEDAEFESRNENIEIAKNKIDAMLKEVCK